MSWLASLRTIMNAFVWAQEAFPWFDFLTVSISFAHEAKLWRPEESECVPSVMLRFLLRCSLQSSIKLVMTSFRVVRTCSRVGKSWESEHENGQGYHFWCCPWTNILGFSLAPSKAQHPGQHSLLTPIFLIMRLASPWFSRYFSILTSAWTHGDDSCSTVTFSPAVRSFFSKSSSSGREPLTPMAAKRCRQTSTAFGRGSELRTGR